MEKGKIDTEVHSYLINTIKQNLLLILFFIVPTYSHFYNDISFTLSTLIILSLLGIILFTKKWKYIFEHLIIFFVVIVTTEYLNNLTKSHFVFGDLLMFLSIYFLWIILILIMGFKFNFSKYEKSEITEKLPKILKVMHTPLNIFKKSVENLMLIYPVLMYFIVTFCTIYFYRNIYLAQQIFIEHFDAFYFSAVTYFTVGFGDILPQTINMKILTICEMFCSSLVNVLFIPLLLAMFYSFITENNKADSNNKMTSRPS